MHTVIPPLEDTIYLFIQRGTGFEEKLYRQSGPRRSVWTGLWIFRHLWHHYSGCHSTETQRFRNAKNTWSEKIAVPMAAMLQKLEAGYWLRKTVFYFSDTLFQENLPENSRFDCTIRVVPEPLLLSVLMLWAHTILNFISTNKAVSSNLLKQPEALRAYCSKNSDFFWVNW